MKYKGRTESTRRLKTAHQAGQRHLQRLCARCRPARFPTFETHLRRKDGTLFPVRLQVSALRNQDGEPIGLVAVALDQSTTSRKEQWKREARERYRDVFENSSEMIATLDLAGRFLYVNPAWRQCFGQDQAAGVEQRVF